MITKEWFNYLPKPNALKDGQQWNVFLSYRSVNRGWVLNLYDVLTEIGFKVFLDQYVLKAGGSLARALEDGLESSQAGILVWSTAAQDSEWVRNEYDVMIGKATSDKSFNFVPIKIDKAPLPVFAKTKLFLDFTDYPDGPNGGDLLRLVYGIVGKPLDDAAVHFATAQNEIAADASDEISVAILNKDPKAIVDLFNSGGVAWETAAVLGCKAGESLTKLGRYEEAINLLNKVQVQFPKSIRPKQLHALALARRRESDDLKNAQKILAKLYAKGERDPETLGIYARTWMDRYNRDNNIEDLRQSRDYYAEAFEKAPDDYYTGINAASKSILLGETGKGIGYAKQVEIIVGNKPITGDYWKTATIAEVLLIQKKYLEAADMYRKAIDMAPNETGSQASTYNQAKLLMEKLKASTKEKLLIARVFENLGEYYIKEINDLDTVEAFIKSGDEYVAVGDYEQALEIYSKGHEKFPREYEFLKKKANIYKKKEDVNQYLEYLKIYNDERNKNTLQRNLKRNIYIKYFATTEHPFYGNLQWNINSKMNILLGKNGYGKSHLLSIMVALLQNDNEKTKEYTPSNAQLSLTLDSDLIFQLSEEQRSELDSITSSYPKNEYELELLDNHQTIMFSRRGLENSYGKVPVLAIPDLRFIDKSSDVLNRPKDNIDLLEDSATHFLYQKSYSTVIENTLLRVCQTYYEQSDKQTPLAIFSILENIFYKLTGSSFTITKIESKLNTGYEILVTTESSTELPLQKVSQGTFSVLSIILIIYNYLKARYPTTVEEKILFQNAIVFIDEIDAHLHPVWQQKIINILRDTFPEIQFFITGHSPLIVAGCQTEEVAVLRKAEKGFQLDFFENDFIGYQPHELYKLIFEMEDYDETYLKYNSLLPFKKSFETEVEALKEREELSEAEKKRLDELYTDLFYMDVVIKKIKEQNSNKLISEQSIISQTEI